LRGLRFMCQLDFSVEEETWRAILTSAPLIAKVSRERIHVEIEKMIMAEAFEKRLTSIISSGVLQILFPDALFEKDKWQRCPEGAEPLRSWMSFWLWYLACRRQPAAKKDLRGLLESFRFTRETKLALEQGLSWFYLPDKLMDQSLGQSIEDCLSKGYWLGFLLLQKSLKGSERERWRKIEEKVKTCQGMKPVPLVTAADLGDRFRGAELGVILKKAYHAQLEGVVSTREQALEFLQDEHS
jgi:tRNA nucleotidyltransferase/poly(A) polymerase